MWINIWTTWVDEIYVWEWIDSSEAMRWPCDSGFHIPTKTERVDLEDTGISLGAWTDSWWSNFKDYLKIPFAWTRKDSTGNTTTQWSMGWYWSCTAYSSNDISWRVYIGTSSLDTKNLMYRTEGCSIRPFRDKPVAPDSWRTTIYAWTWNAWIFHNSTLWLISISSDWNTRITIADKNVWATTVYNNWDTLSQSNCWNYYQRWNNYWFPRTWAITTSSTKADATNYWPWNYYSSSTFITASSSPYNWDSSNNKDLRWWVTWITKKWNVIEVYVGTTKIRPATPPAEFTDWDGNVVDFVTQAFLDAGYELKGAIEIMFGWDFETDTWIDLSDWEFSPIMPFYPVTTSWYGLQISNWWDMIDKHLVPETPWYTQSICIIRDNDNLDDVEYIVWTYDSSDDWFDYQLSSLASHFSGKDTVCMFIFLM